MYAHRNISATLTGWLAYFWEHHCATSWWRILHVWTVCFLWSHFQHVQASALLSPSKMGKTAGSFTLNEKVNVKATFLTANGFLAISMVQFHMGGGRQIYHFRHRIPSVWINSILYVTTPLHTLNSGRIAFSFSHSVSMVFAVSYMKSKQTNSLKVTFVNASSMTLIVGRVILHRHLERGSIHIQPNTITSIVNRSLWTWACFGVKRRICYISKVFNRSDTQTIGTGFVRK